MWAGVALICCGLVMIALQADRHLFRTTSAGGSQPKAIKEPLSPVVRPYVYIESASVNFSSNKPIAPTLALVNKGASTATNITMTAEIILPRDNPPPDLSGMYRTHSLGFLASTTEIDVEIDPGILDRKYLREVQQGKKLLAIRATLTYQDLADGIYPVEEYCFEYDRKVKEFIPCFTKGADAAMKKAAEKQ